VDSSQVGLDKLKKLAEKNKVQINTICSDLKDFNFEEGAWDFIVSIWCHLPSSLRSYIHKESNRGLKKGGYFILEAYTPRQLQFKTGGPQEPDLMPTLKLLNEELRGLQFIVEQELDRDISEGVGHKGMSAVVQVVARK
jgi:hypothetical protein